VSIHQQFRRTPVPQQAMQQMQVAQIPAPNRGIIESENLAFMPPGASLVQENWVSTMRGVRLRGGSIRWCDLHALDTTVPPVPSPLRQPVVSAFEYVSGNIQRMFAAQRTKLFDVTAAGPILVKDNQTSGNYAASQMANASGDYLTAVNDGGDFPLRFDGTTWTVLDANQISGPVGSRVEHGRNLTYVWKYRNRLFFIEGASMNAWYLPLNAINGTLAMIPLSGAATKGGRLLFGATWSLDAGDGIDDKIVIGTDLGELLIFTGSNPADAANWRQEGRYEVAPPLGMNAHHPIGGDLLLATVEGVVPVSAAISKDSTQLELAAITRPIKNTWRAEMLEKRQHPWSMERWDEYGGLFVTWPYGKPGEQRCGVVNISTGAWSKIVGWDATCFCRLRGDMFFGTQDGIIMQADRTGYDDGNHRKIPYVATLVGGWEQFRTGGGTVVWRQARASFFASNGEPFQPQLSATTDYLIKIPQPPPAGADPGLQDVWDQGLWDQAKWDQPSLGVPVVRNTGWVSIGETGYTHAPIIQVTVAQQATPKVELIVIAATYERAGYAV
jgi:hypothetical protein